MSCIAHEYGHLATRLNLPLLQYLFHYHNMVFAFKLINDLINGQPLCDLTIGRTVPYFLRSPRELVEENHRSNYGFCSLVVRLRREWNNLSDGMRTDPSLKSLRNELRSSGTTAARE